MFERRFFLAGCLVGLAGCTQDYTLDLKDIPLDPPADLEARLVRYRSGEDRWLGDPKAVADKALMDRLSIDAAPWTAFRPEAYQIKQKPEWGTYVTRGYTFPSGAVARYRVKVRPYFEIWYPVEISHYKGHTLPHPALED